MTGRAECSCAEDVVCGACMTGASVPAAVAPTREEAARAATEALAAFDRADIFTVLQTVPALAQTLRELLTAVTTPTSPADDVLEAVDHAVRGALSPLGIEYVPWWKVVHAVRDSLLSESTLEVRPRGPVTDAEVEAAYQAIRRNWRITREDARAALEAARAVQL